MENTEKYGLDMAETVVRWHGGAMRQSGRPLVGLFATLVAFNSGRNRDVRRTRAFRPSPCPLPQSGGLC